MWIPVLNAIGLLLALLVVAETFRSKPIWPRPDKSASPRQRRWLGSGLAATMAGSTVTWFNATGVTNLGLVAFFLLVLGVAAIVVAILKGPTDEELERRAGIRHDAGA